MSANARAAWLLAAAFFLTGLLLPGISLFILLCVIYVIFAVAVFTR